MLLKVACVLQSSSNVSFRVLANALATGVVTMNSRTFTAYVFPKEEARQYGTKRTKQRFEQCLGFLQRHMRPAVEAMMAASLYDKTVQESATELTTLAVSDSIRHITNSADFTNETKALMIEKLENVKIWVMFPDEILNVTKINELYDELDFNGTENFVEQFIELPKYDRKLETEPINSWVKIMRRAISNDFTSYSTDDNLISEFTQ